MNKDKHENQKKKFDYDKKRYKKYNLIQNINHAFDGVFEAMRTEKHMKFHAFLTIILVLVCIFSNLTKYEIISLTLAMGGLWVAELFNSALESVVDMITEEYHPLAKRAKDIAAGAVLITAICAVIVAYLVFNKNLSLYLGQFFHRFRGSFQNTIVVVFVAVVVVVILLKVIFRKGTILQGGMPSGHSALGAACFTAVAFLTHDSRVFFLGLLLLVLVMQSRIEAKIHTLLETLIGAFLGAGITYLIFTFLNF